MVAGKFFITCVIITILASAWKWHRHEGVNSESSNCALLILSHHLAIHLKLSNTT